ncbi:MAG: DUF4261 domain-containing protein [Acidobacteriota bacterium]
MLESYRIELLFSEPPQTEKLEEAVADNLEGVVDVQTVADGSLRLVEALEHEISPLPEWRLGPPVLRSPSTLEPSLQQSWWWPEARAAAAATTCSLPLFDANNRTTNFRRRLEVCQRIAIAAIDALRPVAVEWIPSQQLLEPQQFAASVREDGFGTPLPGGVNVRFFALEYDDAAGDQEYLMDTLGLGALGLADLQCHFRGLDPEEVSRTLYETACYQFDNGTILGDGDTVQGPRGDDRWKCVHGVSLAEPERGVVDLDPGFPFSAGQTLES